MSTHMQQPANKQSRREAGYTLIELLMVFVLMGIMTAIVVPQLAAQRRLMRSAAVPREILTQLRYARQQAMSQRQCFTFQYNNTTKQILVIDNNAAGVAVLSASGYPNNSGSVVAVTSSLAVSGLSTAEIIYGSPAGYPTTLDDGVARTSLASSKINVTFQPDGSVIDASGNPLDRGLFFYNNKVPAQTAAAISVLGSAGRIKLWRYESGTNSYIE